MRAMHNFTARATLIDEVDNIHTRRALRSHGIDMSVREICDLVYSGDRDERTRISSQLLAVCDDPSIEMLLVAAYSGYIGGQIDCTRSDLSEEEMWSVGLDALVRAVRASARCAGGDFHIIRSMTRDFVRAIVRHRRRSQREARYLRMTRGSRLVEPSTSFDEELTSASVSELVEWVSTEFGAELAMAQMVVATRIGGFTLGDGQTSTQRVRNCRERKRIEAQIRGFVNPAEGLAEIVLSRAA